MLTFQFTAAFVYVVIFYADFILTNRNSNKQSAMAQGFANVFGNFSYLSYACLLNLQRKAGSMVEKVGK
jgi:hypothetical protein